MTDDTEHDAWLREALRHAPDSGAAPPRVVSAAILAEARAAAARPTTASGRRRATSSMNPLLVFWAWLARPAVAAGFASVMAATLVGLMWWDRPMDETLPRAPALSEATRLPTATAPTASMSPAAPAAPAAATTAAQPAPRDTTGAATATAPDLAQARREAKIADAADASRAKDVPAKEHMEARKSDAPAAFPAGEGGRERAELAAARPPTEDAKKEAVAPTPTPATAPAPFAAQQAAPPAPAPAAVPAPAQSGRLAADEARNTVSSRGDVAATAKSAAQRSAVAEARPIEADALTPSGAAAQGEPPARLRRDGGTTSASPLAPLLASLSGESSRASRQAAGGAAIAVEPAWRDWLIDLDAASAGRWRRSAESREPAGATAEKQGAATLRLGIDGRPAAVIQVDGTTVHLETFGATPERWQATLAPAAAERLRTTLAGLPP